ncbi:MAG: AAA family ATPase [Thermomicrobiales bacterium]
MWLIVFRGVAGSGKSTVSRALSRAQGWPVVDKDDVKDILDGHADDAGGRAYLVMFNVARRQLLQGLSVVCDSPLSFAQFYERARQIAAETGAMLAIIECHCPDGAIWRERINGRKALGLPAHHQTDWEAYRIHLDRMLPAMQYPITDRHLVVDTTRPLIHIVTEITNWLEREGQ